MLTFRNQSDILSVESTNKEKRQMNTILTKESLVIHMGHDLDIVGYGGDDEYENLALECNTCNEVLADTDVNNKGELE